MFQTGYAGIGNLSRLPHFIGGWCRWYFTPVQNIDVWPHINPITQALSGKPTLKNGASWFGPVQATNRQLSFTEIPKETFAGTYYEWRVNGQYPGYDPVLQQNLSFHRHIILGIPRSLPNTWVVVGTIQSPLRINFNHDSGKHWIENAITKIELRGECRHRALLIHFSEEEIETGPEISNSYLQTEEFSPILTEDDQPLIN